MKRALVYMGPLDKIALQIHELFRVRMMRDYRSITSPEELKLLPQERVLLMLRMLSFDRRSVDLFIKLNGRIREFSCIVLAEDFDPVALLGARQLPTLAYLNPAKELGHLLHLVHRLEDSGVFNIRSHPRKEVAEWVVLRLKDNQQLSAKLLDVSQMGARVVLESHELPQGTFELIRFNQNRTKFSRMLTKMVWQKQGEKKCVAGLQYISLL